MGHTNSPADTEWGLGTNAGLRSLTFDRLHSTVGGSLGDNIIAVGNKVLNLITVDIYIDIKFLTWESNGTRGHFSYEPFTEPPLSLNE
ncbi:MAG: hypothetical protein OEW87_07295 [Flavobacteriaceae bacterium]|nr:hypothetical protein [Flavobacteriaceae bacterium]